MLKFQFSNGLLSKNINTIKYFFILLYFTLMLFVLEISLNNFFSIYGPGKSVVHWLYFC